MDRSPTSTREGIISRDPTYAVNVDNIEEWLLRLKNWATDAGLQLGANDYSQIEYSEFLPLYIWTSFTLTRSSSPNNDAVINEFSCTGCGETIRVGQIYCTICDQFIACDSCLLIGLRLYGIRGQTGHGQCPACSVECGNTNCSNRRPRDNFEFCADCDPREGCAHCASMTPLGQLALHSHVDQGEYKVCPQCVRFVCAECGGHFASVRDCRINNSTLHICEVCAQGYYDRERAAFEKWPEEDMPVSGSLMIPYSAARPVRTISIETEFDGDGVKVGRALASSGLIAAPRRQNYSTQGNQNDRFPCILKGDGSVTGGELVSYLLDLDNDHHAETLLRVTEVMRGCRELGLAEFSHRAGGHIHIDLHGLTAKDLWAQFTLFNYLQAPIFYMAGSGASFGHRTLAGSGYTAPPATGPFGSAEGFVMGVLEATRGDRAALHYNNFAFAKNRCVCGSFLTGNWSNCSCNLGKATAEWRVWNAEISPRILHGWIAFMQALTARATDWEDFNESDYPTLPWRRVPFERLPKSNVEDIKQRLEWIHRELPLTIHERDSLIHVCKKSQLIGLGEDFLNGLLDIEPNNTFGTKKAAPNPSSRKGTKFELTAVPGAGASANTVDEFYVDEDDEDFDAPDDGDFDW